MQIIKEPSVAYPTCIFGFLQGDVRTETMDDVLVKESFQPAAISLVLNSAPTAVDGVTWAVSGIQKKSHFGFLWMKPFCLHAWVMPQLPKKCAHGGWVPGSEFGKYFRFGLWRWDVAGTLDKVTGRLKHWIGPVTIYINFSFHFD